MADGAETVELPPILTDHRWRHAMDGLRVRIVTHDARFNGLCGEVTGYDSAGFAVVLDGEDEPVAFLWREVRPL